MARRKSNAPKVLLGAEEFAGADAEKEAIEKIAAARAAATKEQEADKKNGDNGGPIMDEDAWRRAANECVAEDLELERLQEEVAEVRGRLSSIKKVAKSLGVDWDVVSDYRKKAKRIRKGEMGEMVTEHRRLGELMRIMNCPLYTQFDMFKMPERADGAPPRPGMDAELQGQAAFRNGEPRDNNAFQQGTEDYANWDQGWFNAREYTIKAMTPASGEGAAH